MIRRAPSDLVSQMRALVAEEAFLWELTQEMTDYLGAGTTVVHGPWQAEDCQRILLRWLDRGLVDCIAVAWATRLDSGEIVHYEYNAGWRSRATGVGQHLILDRDDAHALVGDTATWDREGAGAGVMLCESEATEGLSFDDWLEALAGLPGSLIYEQ